jgi:rSAM/selenodomain-associated transferase 2
MRAPHLSIVVPLLNEVAILPLMLAELSRQQGLDCELLLCDGGSTDGSAQLFAELLPALPFPTRWLAAPRGRALQMNAGAAVANGDYLLFLHADSRFPQADALAVGLATLAAAGPRVAGHFALRFDRSDTAPSFAYYCYESKARLHRPGCIHGDQGFLLPRSFYVELGGFDATLPLLEDDRLASRILAQGTWLLLPCEIVTSARRFEVEGLYQRQVLNAIVMNFAALGWRPFFAAAGELYRSQDRTRRLQLAPLLAGIAALLAAQPWRERWRIWRATGAYVRSQAWQLALLCDMRRNWRQGLPPGAGPLSCLDRHDRWFDRLTDHAGGRFAATLLTWSWFRLLRLRYLL